MTNQEMLDLYIAAEAAVLAGKSYQIAGRMVTRENLRDIRAGRKEFEARVAAEAVTANNPRGGGASIATWNPNGEMRSPFFRRVR